MHQYAILLVLVMLVSVSMGMKKLVFSALLFRHGERQRYDPNFPHVHCYKHLINEGMRQLYISGRYFRSRYVKHMELLPETYDPATIYFRSTYLSRAANSAMSFYTGLYSPEIFQPNPGQFDNVHLPIKESRKKTYSEFWTPNPPAIHTLLKDDDRLMYSYKKAVCPSLKSLKKQKWMSDREKDIAEAYGQADMHAYDHVANTPDLIKLAAHNFLNQIVDYLRLALIQNDVNVGGTKEEILEAILTRDPAYKTYYEWRLSNPEAENLKLLVFGSHDSMVVSMINALGFKLAKRVPVASTISFELYIDEKTKGAYVEVQLNRKRVKIPTCNGICSLAQFVCAVNTYGTFGSDNEYLSKCNNLDLFRTNAN